MTVRDIRPETVAVHKSSFGRIVILNTAEGKKVWIYLTFEQADFLKRELE